MQGHGGEFLNNLPAHKPPGAGKKFLGLPLLRGRADVEAIDQNIGVQKNFSGHSFPPAKTFLRNARNRCAAPALLTGPRILSASRGRTAIGEKENSAWIFAGEPNPSPARSVLHPR